MAVGATGIVAETACSDSDFLFNVGPDINAIRPDADEVDIDSPRGIA